MNDSGEDDTLIVRLPNGRLELTDLGRQWVANAEKKEKSVWLAYIRGKPRLITVPHHGATAPVEPLEPANWGLLILALVTSPSERESLLGDACEQFVSNVKRFGVAWAHVIFWRDTAASTVHLLTRPLMAVLRSLRGTKMPS